MFKIDPQAIYSKADLAEQLEGVMNVETFLDRIGPHIPPRFKGAYWGQDILSALPSVRMDSDADKAPPRALPSLSGGRSRGRGGAPGKAGNPHFIDPSQYGD